MQMAGNFLGEFYQPCATDPDFGDINAFLAQGVCDRIELPLHEFVAIVTSATVAPCDRLSGCEAFEPFHHRQTLGPVASASRSTISSFCSELVRSKRSPSMTAARLCAV